MPLTSPDGHLGALLVGPTNRRAVFVEHDLTLLAGFAGQAGIAADSGPSQGGPRGPAGHADHDRIAADLHDHVIQELFATGMGLQSLVRVQARPEERQRILSLVDSIDATIRRIRTTIFQVKPRSTTGSGLRKQLTRVLDEERLALGVDTQVDFSGPLDLGVPANLAEDATAVSARPCPTSPDTPLPPACRSGSTSPETSSPSRSPTMESDCRTPAGRAE